MTDIRDKVARAIARSTYVRVQGELNLAVEDGFPQISDDTLKAYLEDADAALLACGYQEMSAEIERLRALSEWRPIETAPKDGTAVLGWAHKWPRLLTTWWDDHPKCACWIGGGYMKKIDPPTHWLPLPLPPKTEGGS